MHVILNDYQWQFLTSRARFPAMKSGWATGKTLVLIQRGMKLSQAYQDNLGLVVRKTFKDLADSTIKDFELYTGLKVPMSTRDVVIPGSKSRIMFRHLEELSSGPTKNMIQNVNLGWFSIEQAEEFDTSEQFQMLRGRLRRRLKAYLPYFQAYEQRLKWFSETKACPYCKSEDIAEGEAALAIKTDINMAKRGGWVVCRGCGGVWNRMADPRMDQFHQYLKENEVRSGFVIANANGKNWVWRNWVSPRRANAEDFEGVVACTFDNEHNLPVDYMKDLRSMEHGTETEQRKYRRFVLNDDTEMDVEGAYYLKLIQEARKDGRIGTGIGFRPDPSTATHTSWDLGISDTTAIWWFQRLGQECRLVHYYENNGEGLEHYIRYCDDVAKRLRLHTGKAFWPHDGKKRDLATGKELLATAKEMGLSVTCMTRETRVVGGIERVRKLLPYCTFNETECAGGIDCLEHYQRRKNDRASSEEKSVYSDSPLHDEASNGADAFRYVSAAFRRTGSGMSIDDVKALQEQYS